MAFNVLKGKWLLITKSLWSLKSQPNEKVDWSSSHSRVPQSKVWGTHSKWESHYMMPPKEEDDVAPENNRTAGRQTKHRKKKTPVGELTAQVTMCRGYCIFKTKEDKTHLNVTKWNFDSWKSWHHINKKHVSSLKFFNTKQIMISVKKEKKLQEMILSRFTIQLN